MAIPILSKRREQRDAAFQAAVETAVQSEVEKALSPAVAQAAAQGQGSSGATYGLNPSSPFGQTGGYGDAYNPLPRGDSNFNSLFGPGYPLIPDPLDPLTRDGRSLTRRTQYLVSANLQLIDRRIPWSVLKGLAEDVDIVARCIQIVQDAIVGLDWSWGFSSQIVDQIMAEQDLTNSAKATAIAREKYGDELQRVQKFFERPDALMDFTFEQWLTDIIWSHLVYDGIVISPTYNLGGELMALSTIDTSTIKILLDNRGFLPQPPAPSYQQLLYGFPRSEHQAENVEPDGTVPNGYRQDQLAYYIRRPHPSSVYGYSQVEECINIATIYMERQAWLHAEYATGVTPKMYIETAQTENWTPEQLGMYEQMLNDQWSGQTQRRQQVMLGRPGMKPTQLKGIEEAYKSDYDAWLAMQIGAKFGIPQSMLGIQMHSSIGGGAAGKQQSDQSEQFATDALRNFLIGCINRMARRFMGAGPEITITATGGGNDEDDLTRAQADASDVGAGIRTRNEIRAERGIPLMNEPEADALGVTVSTGVSFLAGALAQQESAASITAQTAAGMSQQPEGAPSGSGDDGQSDDGQQPSDGGAGDDQGASDGDTGPGDGSQPGTGADDDIDPKDVTAKDDPRQPDADGAEKELAAFVKFAKARIGRGTWRDFTFHHVGAVHAHALNTAGAVGSMPDVNDAVSKALGRYDDISEADKRLLGRDNWPDATVEVVTLDYSGKPRVVLGPGDRLIVERGLGKARAQASTWAKQPQRKFHDLIAAYYGKKLDETLRASAKGIPAAVAAARSKIKTRAAKAEGDLPAASSAAGREAAQAAVSSNVTLDMAQVRAILQQLYGDSYATGTHAAIQQAGGANLATDLTDADSAIDWDDWEPGSDAAADLVRGDALSGLLDSMGVTIQSIEDTAMERLGNALADGLAAGDSNDTIAASLDDVVSGNADMIAATEASRAQEAATMATYQDSGVDQYNWLAEDSACPVCLDNADNGPYGTDDDPDPAVPAHPSCRCTYLPVILDADGNNIAPTGLDEDDE